MTMKWTKIVGFQTKYPADSVEWCPFQEYDDYFVCGTYLLEEENRIGIIYLMKIVGDCVQVVQELETPGILDIKWCCERINGKMLVAAALADGNLQIYDFSDNLIELGRLCLKNDEKGPYMILAVNWFKLSENEAKICVTDNKGNAAVVLYVADNLSLLEKWNAHSLEAWTIAFDVNNSEILYTGGDDAKLKIWDRRSSGLKTLKCQDTGVTIIETKTGKPNEILSGSFDEILNFWDTRQMRLPIHNLKSSGGLWRIKCRQNYILTANIYGGFEIIHYDSTDPKVVGSFQEHHSSLAYGADWGKSTKNGHYVATCSFYDKTLCISKWEI